MPERHDLLLEIPEETYERFESLKKALGHDELEETLELLIHLGVSAVSITSKDNPLLRMYTTTESFTKRTFTCQNCNSEVSSTPLSGYKEVAVKMS